MVEIINNYIDNKNNKFKKAFTIVELVIVIAVIAILSAVLIPTFNNVIESANMSKATQEVKNVIKGFYNGNIDFNLDDLVIVYFDKNSDNYQKDNDRGIYENIVKYRPVKYIFTYKDQQLKALDYKNYYFDEEILYVDGVFYYEFDNNSFEGIPEHIVLYTTEDQTEYYNLIIDGKSKLISNEEKARVQNEYRKGEIITITLEEKHNIKYLLYVNEEKSTNYNVVSYYSTILDGDSSVRSIKEIAIKIEKDMVIRIDYIDLYKITIDNDSKQFFDNSVIDELQKYHENNEDITIAPILSKQYDLELYVNDILVSTLKLGENETYTFNLVEDTTIKIINVDVIEPPKENALLLSQIEPKLNDLDLYKVNEIILKNPILFDEFVYSPSGTIFKECIYLANKANIMEYLTSLCNLQYKLYQEPVSNDYAISYDYVESFVFLLDDEVIEVTIENKYVIDGNIYLLDSENSIYPSIYDYNYYYGFVIDTDNDEARVCVNDPNNQTDTYVDIDSAQESIDLRRLVLSNESMYDSPAVIETINFDELKTKYLNVDNNYFEIVDDYTINISGMNYYKISAYSLESFKKEHIVDVRVSNVISKEIYSLFKVRVDDYIKLGFVDEAIKELTEYKDIIFDYTVSNHNISNSIVYNNPSFDDKITIDSQGWTITCEYNQYYYYDLTIIDNYNILNDNVVSSLIGKYHSGSKVYLNINDLELPEEKVLLITETSDERFIQTKYKHGGDVSHGINIIGSDVVIELLIVDDSNVFEEEVYLKDINKDVGEITNLDAEYIREIVYIEESKLSGSNTLTECYYVLSNTEKEKEYVFHFISCLKEMKYSSFKYVTNAIPSDSTGYYIVTLNDGTSYSFMLSGVINNSSSNPDSVNPLYLQLTDMMFVSVKNSNVAREGLTLFNSSMLYQDGYYELKPNHMAILYNYDFETNTYIDVRSIIFEEISLDSNVIDETNNYNIRINKSSNLNYINSEDKNIIYITSKNTIRIDSNNQKYHYGVVNDFTFEKYLPCIIMTCIIQIYNLSDELLCAIRVSLGQGINKQDLLKHLNNEYTENAIFVNKTYIGTPGSVPEDIFGDSGVFFVTESIEIMVLEIYTDVSNIN